MTTLEKLEQNQEEISIRVKGILDNQNVILVKLRDISDQLMFIHRETNGVNKS